MLLNDIFNVSVSTVEEKGVSITSGPPRSVSFKNDKNDSPPICGELNPMQTINLVKLRFRLNIRPYKAFYRKRTLGRSYKHRFQFIVSSLMENIFILGRDVFVEHVKKYELAFSTDGTNFQKYEENGKSKVKN